MRGGMVIVLLAAAASVSASATPASLPRASQSITLQLECNLLTRYLRTFIGTRTDLFMHYSDDNCLTSSLMQMFLRETTALLPLQAAAPGHVNLTLAEDKQELAQILVLALVGRHYTARFQAGQFFFEYDPASQILTPQMPRCEYQRSFLVLLLFVTIVLLVFALVTQSLTAAETARAAAAHSAHGTPSAPPAQPGFNSNLNSHLNCISIDFAHKRRGTHAYSAL